MLARWLKAHIDRVRKVLFLLGCAPAVALLWAYDTENLGANPLETLTTATGLAALYFLILSLLITPLRRWVSQLAQLGGWSYGKRVADWNALVKLRRQLGLWSVFYACVHAAIYLEFDLAWSLAFFAEEVLAKPYLAIGLLALILLMPLALTSPKSVMRRMGRHWLRLHRLVYAIALLVVTHAMLQARAGTTPYALEATIIALLLGYRLALSAGWVGRWQGQDGLEAPERAGSTA